MRLALIIEYEGTQYHGFQYQVNAPSIQEELEKAIKRLTGECIRIKGAGRTDAGVHASGQVIAFDTAAEHTTATVVAALNHYLPHDIAVKAAYIVESDFHPRRNAQSRTYRYSILNSAVRSPLMSRFTCRIRQHLDVRRMHEAAQMFLGQHDFRRFAAVPQGCSVSSVRSISGASVERTGDVITIEVTGNAFLQHQVRRMAGSLADIGRDRLSPHDLEIMIDNGQTDRVAHSLPPQGLCLVGVQYADFPLE